MTVERRADPDEIREELLEAVAGRDAERIGVLLRQVPADEAVEILDRLPPARLASALSLLGDEALAELLEDAEAFSAARLLVKMGRAQAADVLEEMAPDDATDLVEELEEDEAEAILVEMESTDAEAIRELMAYPPETAGGRMTPEFVALSPDLTVDQALAAIRAVAEEAETIYYAYVTEADGRLVGVVNLRDLVVARPGTPVGQIMNPDPSCVSADTDQEVAARLLADRGFLALPVVDAQDRLLGIITADDATDILEKETSEDIERLGGSGPLDQPYLSAGPLTLAKKRIVWLLLLFVAAGYTSSILQAFEAELQTAVALTFFIPLLIGTGGNTGSQTVTTVIRAMAVGEVEFADLFRVWRKEVLTGAIMGLVLAAAGLVRAWMLGVTPEIALTVAVTAGAICVWATTVAAILPLVLRRLRFDPAVVSAPLITTLVDGTGLILYFQLARFLMAI